MICIEFAAPRGRAVFFQPLNRAIRGRLDFIRHRGLASLLPTWGDALPGMRLEIDTVNKTAALVESLHGKDHAAQRDMIARRGQTLSPERETFTGIDVPTWMYWLTRLRDSGSLIVLTGDLPASVEACRAQYGAPRLPHPPVDPNVSRLDKLIATLWGVLSDKQRGEAEKLLAASA